MRFAYRIEGVDADWKDLENRHALYFYPPAPGTYSVRIKAANNDGIWNEAGVSLAFTVQPLLWQTAWFRFLVLAGLSTATGVVVWRLGRARLQAKIERLEQQRACPEHRHQACEMQRAAQSQSCGRSKASVILHPHSRN
jgi:hypothetical protein